MAKMMEEDRRKGRYPTKDAQQIHVAFIDLRKAYDKVNRDLLLVKLIERNIQ